MENEQIKQEWEKIADEVENCTVEFLEKFFDICVKNRISAGLAEMAACKSMEQLLLTTVTTSMANNPKFKDEVPLESIYQEMTAYIDKFNSYLSAEHEDNCQSIYNGLNKGNKTIH